MNNRITYAAVLLLIAGCNLFAPPRAWAQLLPPLPPPLPGGSLIVTITSPASGFTVSGTVPVTASVSIVGSLTVAGVRFFLDGSALGAEDTSAPYSVSWNTTTASNGSHTLIAVARDALGVQFTSNPVTVTISNGPPPDTTLPSVTMTAPSSGATVSGTIPVSANASDNVGIAGVQFKLDGANLGAEEKFAPYAISWNTTTASNGSHTITAVARDAAGNIGESAVVTVTVANGVQDTTPPAVTITSPTAGATVSGTIPVSATASDNVGVAGVRFFAGTVEIAVEDTTAPYEVSWNTTTLADGFHTLIAVARDGAGNTTTSAGITVTVSNGGPAVTRFEEDNPAVSATGAWVRRGPEVAAFSGGTAGSSDMPAATVTFTFTGTAVSWIGLRCNVCGIATVSIDGGAANSVDTAGPATVGSPGLASETVFTASGLAAGTTHTLVITVTGTTTSGGAHIIVDAFDVTP